MMFWSRQKNLQDHKQHVAEVMRRLKDAGLTTRPDKCQFSRPNVLFLGFNISAKGVSAAEEKVGPLREQPLPYTLSELSKFLGATTYYRRFVPKMVHLAAPLHKNISTIRHDATRGRPDGSARRR